MTQAIVEETYVVTPAVEEEIGPSQSGVSFYLASMLFGATLVCFAGALLADYTYLGDPDIAWSNFSTWLLAFGEFFIALVVLFGIIGYFVYRDFPRSASNWLYGLFVLAAAITGLFDNFIHTHDGWTSVAGTGIALSAATLVLLLIGGLFKLATLSQTYVVDAR